MEKKVKNITVLVSMLLVLLMEIFYFIIQYYQLPMGDDTLAPFLNMTQHYVSNGNWTPDVKITTFSMMITAIIDYWKHFGGRISTVFWVPLLGIVGQKVCAFIGATVYTGIILCIGRIAWGEWKKIFDHPLALLIIALYQYYLTATSSYMQMWTMVCHYAMPTFLCLIYYIYADWLMHQKKIYKWNILGIIVLGLLTGTTHEVIALLCIIMVGIRGIVLLKKYRMKFKRVYIHTGLIIGYTICVFAPGNWERMKISHDAARTQTGILFKIKTSMEAHILAMGLQEKWPLIILSICFVCMMLTIFIWNKKKLRDVIEENIEILAVIISSLLIWTIFAPPVPQYGLQFTKACICIFIFRNMEVKMQKGSISLCIAIVSILWVSITNISWCRELVETTTLRREQIQTALSAGKTEVTVSRYPDSTAKYVTFFNRANEDIYLDVCSKIYYGIEIHVEK